MKTKLLIAMLLILQLGMAAQERPNTYNYQRGVEAIKNENVTEALDYFNRDIAENPKNGYSYSWIAMLRNHTREYGRALTAADLALKYIPKKDVEYVVFCYSTRAKVYLNLEDTVKALSDYSSAIRCDPKLSSLYEERAQIYFNQRRYDLAEADYKKMIELDPGSVMGYMGLGRNANSQKNWQEAIKQFDYVTKLASDYSSGYAFRAESFVGLEKWNEATDDIISAISLDWDRKAIYLATTLKDPALTMLISKMKVQTARSPNEMTWPYVLGMLYEQHRQYDKAVQFYSDANAISVSPVTYRRIAECHYENGDFSQALENINKALNIDSTDVDNMSLKANYYYEMGEPELAVAEWNVILKKVPDYAWGYYRRGWFKELMGDNDGAIDDLSMAIVLDPEYAYSYASRGDIYKKMGKTELAEADFKKVIELEDTPDKYECIHYAYQGLGQYDKAIAAVDSIIARDDSDAGSHYDAACMYSRMKDKENALRHLERALELGYRRFAHIAKDFDLDFIRDSEDFKQLIEKYSVSQAPVHSSNSAGKNDKNMVTTEVPFVKENGVCKVKCQINGLPLHFVFDTGASDVTLSLVEANFMMKNGYLTGQDVIGNQRYMDANGDISVGTIINLKSVDFADFNLTNVRATVVRNQNAPLLLGQSVLGRLGRIEIDNHELVLRITHSKEY